MSKESILVHNDCRPKALLEAKKYLDIADNDVFDSVDIYANEIEKFRTIKLE